MTCAGTIYKAVFCMAILWIYIKDGVDGRAMLVEPPQRSSLWRFKYNTTRNYRDDMLNCGGYNWQWNVHDGRCGVCGDPFNSTQENDDEGRFASGIIVRKYLDTNYVNITFQVSNNYLGYVEFRLCPRNDTSAKLEQSCFDKYPLWIDESYGTRYYIGSRGGIHDVHIRLTGGIVCKKCVLQWTYYTGYRYDGTDTCKCLGCGKQETYINCADVEIYPPSGWGDTTSSPTPVSTKPTTTVTRPPTQAPTSKVPKVKTTTPGLTADTVIPTTVPTVFPPSDSTTEGIQNATVVVSSSDKAVSLKPTSVTERPIHLGSTVSQSSPKSTNVSKFEWTKHPTSFPSFGPRKQSSGPPTELVIQTPFMPSSETTTLPTLTKTTRPFPPPIFLETNGDQAVGVVPTTFFPATPKDRTAVTDTSTVANTQFVSVSDILNRFYADFLPPYIFPHILLPDSSAKAGSQNGGKSTTKKPRCDVTSDDFRCRARGIYQLSTGVNNWCEVNCKINNCITFICECYCEERPPVVKSKCHAIGDFKGVEGMDMWCAANCKVGYCPPKMCSMEDCTPPEQHPNGET